ncbi:hypothetical protein MC885_010696 [Smutsia gigantea]|nr:hypothetical protein MC885_010696 [Smutsia gigantea]
MGTPRPNRPEGCGFCGRSWLPRDTGNESEELASRRQCTIPPIPSLPRAQGGSLLWPLCLPFPKPLKWLLLGVEEAKLDTIPQHVTSLLLSSKALGQSNKRDRDPVIYQMLYGVEAKGKRLSMAPGSYAKATGNPSFRPHPLPADRPSHLLQDLTPWGVCPISEMDTVTLEPTQWPTAYRRQSITEPTLPDSLFAQRRSMLLRDWLGKLPDSSYERKLKSLMEKGTKPKMEMVKTLKPEEVLRCR